MDWERALHHKLVPTLRALWREPQFLLRYLCTSAPKRSPVAGGWPWWTFRAIQLMDGLVAGKNVVEFGAGGSTVRYAPVAKRYRCFEDDSGWREQVDRALAVRRAGGCCEWLVPTATERGLPLAAVEAIRRVDWSAVDAVIVDHADRDGLDRAESFRSVVGSVRPGTMILLDDCDRYDGQLDLASCEVIYRGSGVGPGSRLVHHTAIFRLAAGAGARGAGPGIAIARAAHPL